MSDSNRIQVAYKKETTYGQNAGNSSDAEYASLRITGESLHKKHRQLLQQKLGLTVRFLMLSGLT